MAPNRSCNVVTTQKSKTRLKWDIRLRLLRQDKSSTFDDSPSIAIIRTCQIEPGRNARARGYKFPCHEKLCKFNASCFAVLAELATDKICFVAQLVDISHHYKIMQLPAVLTFLGAWRDWPSLS